MGDASDRVKDAAGEAATETLESAKAVAGKVVERTRSAVREEGFSPSAVSDAAKDLAEGVRQGVAPSSPSASPTKDSSPATRQGAAPSSPGPAKEPTVVGLATPVSGAGPQELTDVKRTGP